MNKTELENKLWGEKYRPSNFDELILSEKNLIKKYLKTLPSFIFFSNSAGTGKTSCSYVIIKTLGCDFRVLNGSDERGIDVIREKVKLFSMSMASNNLKKCIFIDEMESLTPDSQKALKFLIEEYSDNVFFIFSTNFVNKIISPIRSRCVEVNFDSPPKDEIYKRLKLIIQIEKIDKKEDFIQETIDKYYPDVRSMIKELQDIKIGDRDIVNLEKTYTKFFEDILYKDIDAIYKTAYSKSFNILGFNTWLFNYIFQNQEKFTFEKLSKVALLLADTEKASSISVNLPIIFVSNICEITRIL